MLGRPAQPAVEPLTPGHIDLAFIQIDEPGAGLFQYQLAQLRLRIAVAHVLL